MINIVRENLYVKICVKVQCITQFVIKYLAGLKPLGAFFMPLLDRCLIECLDILNVGN